MQTLDRFVTYDLFLWLYANATTPEQSRVAYNALRIMNPDGPLFSVSALTEQPSARKEFQKLEIYRFAQVLWPIDRVRKLLRCEWRTVRDGYAVWRGMTEEQRAAAHVRHLELCRKGYTTALREDAYVLGVKLGNPMNMPKRVYAWSEEHEREEAAKAKRPWLSKPINLVD